MNSAQTTVIISYDLSGLTDLLFISPSYRGELANNENVIYTSLDMWAVEYKIDLYSRIY